MTKHLPPSIAAWSGDVPERTGDVAPGWTSDGATLQSRMRLYLVVLLAMTAGIHGTISLVRLVVDHHPLSRVFDADGIARVTLMVVLGIAALACTRWRLSRAMLLGFDAGSALLVAAFGILGMTSRPVALRPEMGVLLAVALLLLARASLLPSTAARTVAVGMAALLPLLLLAPLFYPADAAIGDVPMRRIARVTIFAFGGAIVALTALTSGVIYRLQRRLGRSLHLGPYRIGRKLGEGGMGTVYEARHLGLGRITALKLVKGPRLEGEAVARFEREARLTAELSHPNTVALYDYGQTSDGIAYYAMELIDGLTLERLVRAAGPLPAGRALSILRQVAASLAQAHDASLVHRDIKPANVMVCWRHGQPDLVKVLDFGLAKRMVLRAPGEGRSSVVGTPQFMAPEAVFDPTALGAPADVYAVGMLGYWLLTGALVFDGHRMCSVAAAHRSEPPLPPSLRTSADVPRDLEEVLLRCLAKRPEDRYADGAALLTALDACHATGWTVGDAERWWHTTMDDQAPAAAAVTPLPTEVMDTVPPATRPFALVRAQAG